MNRIQVKYELTNRYKYIYENAATILAPFMYQQTNEERDEMNNKFRKDKRNHFLISDERLIYLKELPKELLLDLESFLLSDTHYENSKLYIELEEKKEKASYLYRVKNGLNLLEQSNLKRSDLFKTKLDAWKLLTTVREFINEQSGDLCNKRKKLEALDEYFRISRYTNDGKLWTSGYGINLRDMEKYVVYSSVSMKNDREPGRDKNDTGLKKGEFIYFVANRANHYDDNFSILTEKEKQDIYLTYHDELPWDLKITCAVDGDYYSSPMATKLERPEHTKPCGKTFNIDEKEIFVEEDEPYYRYYQLCPHCGYIVSIPEDLLSNGIENRIEERCSNDPNLFRKMYLYSELFSLDKASTKNQKKLLKIANKVEKTDI